MSATTASAALSDPGDIRPVVRTAAQGNLGLIAFVVVLLIGGFLLFQGLSSRRQDLNGPPAGSSGTLVSAPPPLSLPSNWYQTEVGPYPPAQPVLNRAPAAQTPSVVTRIVERPQPVVERAPAGPDEPYNFPPAPGPVPATAFPAPPPISEPASVAEEPTFGSAQARRLPNPRYTIPQGTVIAAVLETALDSTRPGAVRALVSRDVKSFDGSRVLIQRGSRIYGEYTSDVGPGQKRALIQWHRLTRPDGVIIDLDSPATDPLGRAGVRGKVNSHFFERFSSAIVQSILDIGVGIATREATDGVIVALPGSTQNISGTAPTQITPTLSVRQGTSVSVFVARDLDFSRVES